MKRETSLRNAQHVADRLKAVCGLISTPNCRQAAVRVRRAWLFGSTAKGGGNPNDTDIILETVVVAGTAKWAGRNGKVSGYYKIDKYYRNAHGLQLPMESLTEAKRYLRGSKKMLRLHDWDIDGEVADGRIMIYPINNLKSISK